MTTLQEEISSTARTILRDYPKFFQSNSVAGGRTYDLGHPNVIPTTLYVATAINGVASPIAPPSYALDSRNGLLRLMSSPDPAATLLVEGYHYEWLSQGDLDFFAEMAVEDHDNLGYPLSSMSAAGRNVVARYALVQSLWSLLSEYARDIDVETTEAVHIPATQRYHQVLQLVQYWEAKYKEGAQALNIGLDRLQILTLRRVSRTTGRLVPIVIPKEVGDIDPWERVFPAIDPGIVSAEEEGDELRGEALIELDPPTTQTYLYVTP